MLLLSLLLRLVVVVVDVAVVVVVAVVAVVGLAGVVVVTSPGQAAAVAVAEEHLPKDRRTDLPIGGLVSLRLSWCGSAKRRQT